MSTKNFRVKQVRKALKMTQSDFGERLYVSQNYLSQIENGDRDVTDKISKLICLEFNVSEEWLETGIGGNENMFKVFPSEDEFAKAAASISKENDPLIMATVIEYWKLDEPSKEVIKNLVKNIMKKSKYIESTTNEYNE